MPRTEEQYEQIRKEKRQLILDTALVLFADNGYDNTSIQAIAKKAGISKGLIYNYFESKEHLVKEILMSFVNNMYAEFDPNKDGILTKEEFRYFIKYSIRNIKENTSQYKLYIALSTQPHAFEVIQEAFDGNKMIGLILKELYDYFQREGYENAIQEVSLLTSILKGAALQYVYNPGAVDLDFVEKRILEMYCK